MNDRESFLRAIDKEPKERLPKLLYADWLEEYGTSEADSATVEFIRLTNHELHTSKTGRWKRTTAAWLKENWERLVATARKQHKPAEVYADALAAIEAERLEADDSRFDEAPYREGREFQVHRWNGSRHLITHWNLAPPGWNDATPRFYSYRVYIHFGNGFVTAFEAVNPHAQAKLNHLVLVDQPLCEVHGRVTEIDQGSITVVCPECGTKQTFGSLRIGEVPCSGGTGTAWCDYAFHFEKFMPLWERLRQNVYEPRQPNDITGLAGVTS
jgi:uncharacterized protein (TIGR02996 family)